MRWLGRLQPRIFFAAKMTYVGDQSREETHDSLTMERPTLRDSLIVILFDMELVSCEYEWPVGLKIYLHAARLGQNTRYTSIILVWR
jgi:hypothetical protein